MAQDPTTKKPGKADGDVEDELRFHGWVLLLIKVVSVLTR